MDPPDPGTEARTVRLTDATAVRALAHPLRMRLLGLLRRDGPSTASRLAAQVDQVPASTSYHLRILARHGFIIEAPDLARDGRERWWQAAHDQTSWEPAEVRHDPDLELATNALEESVVRHYDQQLTAWRSERSSWDPDWIDAAQMSDWLLRLTPELLRELKAELAAVVNRAAQRQASRDDSEARWVTVIQHAFPAPPDEPGPRAEDPSADGVR